MKSLFVFHRCAQDACDARDARDARENEKYHNMYSLKMPHMRSMLNQMASKYIFTQSVSSFNDTNTIHSQT